MEGKPFQLLAAISIIIISGYTAALPSAQAVLEANDRVCRCMPGDDCWPTIEEWTRFNSTLHGRLIATVPIGTPCHDPYYNASACDYVQQHWDDPSLHYKSSSSLMASFFANRSCDPFSPDALPCTLGNYPRYAINVTEPEDIAKGIIFAQTRNIRLVIRNTGHDYIGKSTGAGALSVWTHHLKDINFLHYSSPYYSGPAMKVGSGVQVFEANEAADKRSLAVVGGECPTVGLAGGYSQGGGHSALASKYGLAADQTLEWEVIDGSGRSIRASRSENSDLYWALSGGGGGTYGIVYSMTSKVHEDIPITSAGLSFSHEGLSTDTFYSGIESLHPHLGSLVDAGCMIITFFSNASFAIAPLTAPGLSTSEVHALLKPYTDDLRRLDIKYNLTVAHFPSYLSDYTASFPYVAANVFQLGGRLIPRSVVEQKSEKLVAAFRNIIEDGGSIITVNLNVSRGAATKGQNAVLPAWRESIIDVVVTSNWNETAPWSDMVADQKKMTDRWIPQLSALTPGSGCYLNEAAQLSLVELADFNQPDWKQTFYGSNYDRLRAIKAKYDPSNLFYATTAVGSDYWAVQADGRLCKAQTSNVKPV